MSTNPLLDSTVLEVPESYWAHLMQLVAAWRGIQGRQNEPPIETFEALLGFAQAEWRDLSKKNDVFKDEKKRDEMCGLLRVLLLGMQITAPAEHYLGYLWFGARPMAIGKRLSQLLMQLLHGSSTESIVALSGNRVLDQVDHNQLTHQFAQFFPCAVDNPWMVGKSFPRDEGQLMEELWYVLLTSSICPERWKRGDFFQLVYCPKENPNTQDTLLEWKERHHPAAGRYMAVTGQPHLHQILVAQNVMGEGYQIDGSAYGNFVDPLVALPALARLLYEFATRQRRALEAMPLINLHHYAI